MPELKVSKTTIITGICGGNLGIDIDLDTFFRKLVINDQIVGAKYHGKIKGSMKGTKSFFNQITFAVFSQETQKIVNVKLFGNGNLHFSGVKNIEQAEISIKIILEQLLAVKGQEEIDVIVVDDCFFNEEDYKDYKDTMTKKDRFEIIKIYSYPDAQGISKKIGVKRKDDYVISGEICVMEGNHFVSAKFVDFSKNIYNKSGEFVGTYKYVPTYKRKNILLKNRVKVQLTPDIVSLVDRYGNENAQIIRTINEPLREVKYSNKIGIEYSALPETYIKQIGSLDSAVEAMKITVMNLNSKFNVSYENKAFDRKKMRDLFADKYKLTSYYEQEGKYQGVALKLYYDKDDVLTRTKSLDLRKVSATFFSSGSVLLSGCTTKKDIIIAKADIVNMLSENVCDIIRKEQIEVDIINPELTIWNLI
jgi:TATA-box binding protein (TBP) (component of TFIID and TFIIIB)